MAKQKRKRLAALDAEQRQGRAPLPPPPPYPPRDQELSCDAFVSRNPPAEVSWASSPFQAGAQDSVADTNPSLHSPDSDSDCNSWVEVRKQRVVIIIPPLPEAKPKPRIGKAAPRRRKAVSSPDNKCNGGAQGTIRRDAPPISSMDILLASALGMNGTPLRVMRSTHIDVFASQAREEPSLDTADSSIQPKATAVKIAKHAETDIAASKRYCKTAHADKSKNVGGCKVVYHSNNSLRASAYSNQGQCTVYSYLPTVNQSLRLVTLRKHLERAGGLKGWLCSLGLGQFKEVFGQRRWSEGELLQLRMEDLKHMGKTAVGPRRKLIWAIHQLSQQMM